MRSFSIFHLLLVVVFISFHSIIQVHADADLIERTCKTTKYYELCVSSLKSNMTSLKADTKGLAEIMVKVGVANATATNAFLSSQVLSTINDPVMKKLIKECADKYGFASDALQASLQDLATDLYDYAYMHVMAAADYPNACHNSFKRYPGLAYPPQVAVLEDGLKHICAVILGIIDNLGW